ncbi:MAG: hypothetical protein KA988_00460 [Longilinea sp.]|nr:hypothetical protein [Longilinea sp.]
MYMILFVLHDCECLDDVLTAWEEAGVSGVTILPSTGLKRLRQKGALRDDVPLIPSIEDLMEHVENTNRTIFTVVDSEAMLEKVVAATESVVGKLDQPNTGILVALPVTRAYGLRRQVR